MNQKLQETAKDDQRAGLYPIKYLIERLPLGKQSEEEQLETIFEILEILSETDRKDFFRSGFI